MLDFTIVIDYKFKPCKTTHRLGENMKTITKSCIRLDVRAQSKDEAIRTAGQLLADAGYIEPSYIDSLLKREQVANTFLGGGVAIPHGMIEDRHLIHHTGIAILQVPNGVEMERRSESPSGGHHCRPIRRAHRPTPSFDPVDAATRSARHPVPRRNPLVLIAALGDAAEPTVVAAPTELAWPADAEVEWTVDYPNGLHARPATRWVETAKRFPCELRIYKG